VRDDVEKAATALLFSVPVPSVAVPSRNVTVPVGVTELLDMIVALNVSGLPLDAEAAETASVAVVAIAAADDMVSVVGAEVLPAKTPLPVYLQMIEWVPTVSVDVVKVATAWLFRDPVPSEVVPSKKTTAPVGVPELLDAIVAVNATGAPLDAEAAELTSTAVVAARVMVSDTGAEVLPRKLESPL
jgi:hypothetical protein